MRLTSTVADPAHHARLIRRDNSAPLTWPVEDAVESGCAFLVRPRPTMLCVDLDVDGCDDVVRAHRERAFEVLRGQLDLIDAGYVISASGRPGHRHLIAHVGPLSTVVRRAWEGQLRRGGLDVRNAGIRPPGSPHRLGLPVELVTPTSAEAAVERLERLPRRPHLLSGELDIRPTLSARMRRVLRDGHEAHQYESASHGRMAIAVNAVANGAGPEYLHRLFKDPRNRLGESFRGRSARWQKAEVERLVRKASDHIAHSAARDESKAQRRVVVERMTATARRQAWPRLAGGSDLAMLEALLTRAHDLARLDVQVAQRTLALDSGLHHATVRRALARLVDSGWLTPTAPATPDTSATWTLRVPHGVTLGPDREMPAAGSDEDDDLSVDLGRRGGVGKVALRVWRVLPAGGVPVDDLAASLSMSVANVRRHLRRLAAWGLASRCGQRWRRGTAAPDGVARTLGVHGVRQRQREAYIEYWADRTRYVRDATTRWLTRSWLRAPAPSSPSRGPDEGSAG